MTTNLKKERMRDYLIQCAIKGSTPSYRELAFHSEIKWSHRTGSYGEEFFQMLEDIGDDEIDAGHPPLNILVRNGKLPGRGFYRWYVKRYPRLKIKDIINDEIFYTRLRDECFEFWRNSSKGMAS